MALRENSIDRLQGVRGLPQPATGRSSGLRECEVVVVGENGTLDARQVGSRSVTVRARYPRWYEPQLHDRVIIGELQGDERMRIVLQAMSTASGGPPKVVS